MNKELYSFITEKKHRAWRHPYAGEDAASFARRGLSPRERMAQRFAQLCREETPHILPGQRIAFMRTVTDVPDILTKEEWDSIRKTHFVHELGYVSNLSPDYASLIRVGLLEAKRFSDAASQCEIDALLELAGR